MSALSYFALGVLVAAVVSAFRVKDTSDASATFASVPDAAQYVIRQENAGYYCWMRAARGGQIQVRCYRRKEGTP
ncbi:hypothetical protein NB717_000072 [Xanthomonas sacchari]|uniref:hypothetical protein n=1 Tax=Xanthomonas sacchari TaxID=56458 RepID=UPI00225E0A05|nr:hypothetical protein [Xanthomonas sacchari]MCW0459004.1 hypothetical protein [Xanthomonas sacchari]